MLTPAISSSIFKNWVRDMSKRFARMALLFLLAGGFVLSCASQQDTVYLNNKINAIQRQAKNDSLELERAIEGLKDSLAASENKSREMEKNLSNEQESIRLSLTQILSEMEELKDVFQDLTGRVEENRHLIKSSLEVDITKEDSKLFQIKELLRRVEDLESRLLKTEGRQGAIAPSGKKSTRAKKEMIPAKEEKKPPAAKKKPQTESDIYNKMLGHYKSGSYKKALEGFKEFIKLYPKSNLADNAAFWIGECYKGLESYEEAILAYQKVIDEYPKGNKVPAAILQQAISFEKINDNTTAKLLLKKLVKNYPNSKEAEIASKKLK